MCKTEKKCALVDWITSAVLEGKCVYHKSLSLRKYTNKEGHYRVYNGRKRNRTATFTDAADAATYFIFDIDMAE